MDMDRRQHEFEELGSNLNEQIEISRSAKAWYILQLNEATASSASSQEQMPEKEQERQEIEAVYRKYMMGCEKRISWILYQDICAPLGRSPPRRAQPFFATHQQRPSTASRGPSGVQSWLHRLGDVFVDRWDAHHRDVHGQSLRRICGARRRRHEDLHDHAR